MSNSTSGAAIRNEVLEEAAGWLVEFRTEDVENAQRRAFDAWLRASPEHVRAYLALLPIWETSAQIDVNGYPDTATLIQWSRESQTNVVPLKRVEGRLSPIAEPAAARSARVKVNVTIAVAASVVLSILGAWFYIQRDTYVTTIGEQRSITLPDGSVVEMNALSKIRIRFNQPERSVDLLSGQALFRVAHNAARPFVVYSDSARIRAVGTQFDVYRKSSGTVVTVVEGRVAVLADSSYSSQPAANAADPPQERPAGAAVDLDGSPLRGKVFVSAGEQVILAPQAALRPALVDLAAATAWTHRRLIFSATPLPEVAAEFNRYNVRQLLIADASLASFRINGVFSSTDPAALVGFLREQPGILVAETDREIRVSRK
jgi:transmembrane sensor